MVSLLLDPETGPGQEPGSVRKLLPGAQSDQGALRPAEGRVGELSEVHLLLPVPVLVLCPALLTAVAHRITQTAQLDAAPEITAKQQYQD